MAPPPEYDKEPKAPDKSATNISTEDSKLLHNLVNDQHTNSDHKPSNTVTTVEVENSKHVETLDDGQLKALLDEAINYKNPKDREGKSKIFKELLEEVEQESEEQACSAARALSGGCRAGAGGAGARRARRGAALAHSNSLQDLVAALAAEPPRRHVRAQPAPPAPSVSARAIHGGSLPSGVDTSSLSEEPARGAGYLATVRCVNPPPLAERRVSASDANSPGEMELLNRRSKPMFPMTYTARATLEIGSGAVCSGRAVTTTTASNQVRNPAPHRPPGPRATTHPQATTDPQAKLMDALATHAREARATDASLSHDQAQSNIRELTGKTNQPRGPKHEALSTDRKATERYSQSWVDNVDHWYKSMPNYSETLNAMNGGNLVKRDVIYDLMNSDLECSRNNVKNLSDLDVKTDVKYKNRSNYAVELTNKYTDLDVKLSEDVEYKNGSKYVDDNKIYSKQAVNKGDEDPLSKDKDSGFESKASAIKMIKHNLVVPTLSDTNPPNVRPMSISRPLLKIQRNSKNKDAVKISEKENESENMPVDINSNTVDVELKHKEEINVTTNVAEDAQNENCGKKCTSDCCNSKKREQLKELVDMFNKLSSYSNADIEMKEIQKKHNRVVTDSFSKYVALQQKLIVEIESLQEEIQNHCDAEHNAKETENAENQIKPNDSLNIENEAYKSNGPGHIGSYEPKQLTSIAEESEESVLSEEQNIAVKSDSDFSAELSNNAYVLLTLPSSNNTESFVSESASKPKTGKKKENLSLAPSHTNKKEDVLNKNILKVLLFENLFKTNNNEKSGMPGVSSITNEEVDTAISFSCITTPEVVASCNTTSSTQSAVAVDPKPLQLRSGYRAVASLTGAALAEPPGFLRRAVPAAPAAPAAPARPNTPTSPPAQPAGAQPRSVISSSFNGLPLSRPNYGAAAAAADDYKKSLDENGNSLQGFSSPLSGSSQHKKPRRKKSSKNETVIDCQQIDGYQGDKDVNELLRFIESNAEHSRGAKLRAKHKDDADDKGKKRSAERRKDKEAKPQRASSLEELSRTTLADLTDAPRRDLLPAKQERRSWGDDAREPFEPPAAELTDFQTVTKKRKPRRRADEPERDPPRRPRPPSPRARRESAPPSDRSNDSNDDLDSVHSLPDAPRAAPPAPAPPAPHASYADIARTRHNIPDLIESCNYYAEAEAPRAPPAPPDDYPALHAAPARRRDKPAPPPPRPRKERTVAPTPTPAPAPDCPAPDVVADRRPPVILLDAAARPRDMDGVTFGFDINEQLLGGPARRPRCDLVRDAVAGVAVRAGLAALRYVPPDPPADTHHLHQIIDYVGAAWEDVVRCGGGKVRYFSE